MTWQLVTLVLGVLSLATFAAVMWRITSVHNAGARLTKESAAHRESILELQRAVEHGLAETTREINALKMRGAMRRA